MGMFDKDKEIGLKLTDEFAKDEPFILWGVRAGGTVETNASGLPPARKTRMKVSKLDTPANHYEVTTLASPIADRADEAEADDFPAIVKWLKVPGQGNSEATVLRFVAPYTGAAAEAARGAGRFEDKPDDTIPF